MTTRETTLQKALDVIELFRRYNLEMPSQTMSVFLCIAIKPGIIRRELEQKTGISAASVIRHIAVLTSKGDMSRLGRPGLGLVFTDVDPMDGRTNRVYLTKEGVRLAKNIQAIMEVPNDCPTARAKARG